MELLLNAYAVAGAIIVLRTLLRALRIGSQIWIGSIVYGITDPFARPILLLPGADFAILGDLTLADATLLAAVILFPIGLLARRRESRPSL